MFVSEHVNDLLICSTVNIVYLASPLTSVFFTYFSLLIYFLRYGDGASNTVGESFPNPNALVALSALTL